MSESCGSEHDAAIGGEPWTPPTKMARLILPVSLTAQARDHFRLCAHCLDLTPDQDLDRGGCNQVGYCPLPYKAGDRVLKYQGVGKAALPAQKPCHKAHWKAGHKTECARFAAEAKAAAAVAAVAAEAAEAAAAAKPGAAGGGGGGKKEKGRKKGKKNRRG